MIVGIFRIELRLLESHSLKEKRNTLRKIIQSLKKQYNICISEIDHRDLRQRATLGLACISRSEYQARNHLNRKEEEIVSKHAAEVISSTLSVSDIDVSE